MSDECITPSCTQHTQDLLTENAQLRRHLRAMQQSMRGIMLQLQAQMSALPLDTVYSLDKFDDFYPSTVSSEGGTVREVQLESKSSDVGLELSREQLRRLVALRDLDRGDEAFQRHVDAVPDTIRDNLGLQRIDETMMSKMHMKTLWSRAILESWQQNGRMPNGVDPMDLLKLGDACV